MKATIYYNMLPHPTENKFSHDMWFAVRKDDIVKISNIQFKKYWKRLPVKEIIKKNKIIRIGLEKIFYKYNNYSMNPYSDYNDPGQSMIKELGVRHTSMMIGDIIEFDNIYYITTSEGFSKVNIE